jgi:hypothetical protein
MARSAFFVCMDCKVKFWLGKAVFHPNDTVDYFFGVGHEAHNWQNQEANHVLWKMLADHAGHPLRVLVEWTPEFDALVEDEEVVWIGGDEIGHEISIEEYLTDWDG